MQTAVELSEGQNLLISGLSTYVAKDKETKPLLVLLKVRKYVETSPTAELRSAPSPVASDSVNADEYNQKPDRLKIARSLSRYLFRPGNY